MAKKKEKTKNNGPLPDKSKLSQSMKKSSTKSNKRPKNTKRNNNNNSSQSKSKVITNFQTVKEFRPNLSKKKQLEKQNRKDRFKQEQKQKQQKPKQQDDEDEEKKPTERDIMKLQDAEVDQLFFKAINPKPGEEENDQLRLIGDVKRYVREGAAQSKRSLRRDLSKGRDTKYSYQGATEATNSIKQARKAALDNARAEILFDQKDRGFIEVEDDEKVWELSQKEIRQEVAVQSARKAFELSLTQFGPYKFDYSRNGRWIILAGRKGHLAMIDSVSKELKHEVHVKDLVRDVKFLHNESMYAVAQKNYVFVYNESGAELHRLKPHDTPVKLEFLPYHFLLVSVSKFGKLVYQDVSTGGIPFNLRMDTASLGAISGALRQNPYNAVVGVGHASGIVSLWAPSGKKPLVKMLCHRGPIRSMAFDRAGHYMVTSGQDHRLRIWDVRTFKMLKEFIRPPTDSIDISQMRVLAAGIDSRIQTWENIFESPVTEGKMPDSYICHRFPGKSPAVVTDIHFCPYDDVLGIGTSQGFASILVPGSGDPNYDSWEADPHQSVSQRNEHEVKMLLEKIQPGMISLDPNFIGSINPLKKMRWQMDVQQKEVEQKEEKETEALAESWAQRMARNRKMFEQGNLPDISVEADRLQLQMMEKEMKPEREHDDQEENEVPSGRDKSQKKKKNPAKGVVTKPFRLRPLDNKKSNDNNRSSRSKEPQFEVPSALDRFKKKPRNE